jgi:hypothetical protein
MFFVGSAVVETRLKWFRNSYSYPPLSLIFNWALSSMQTAMWLIRTPRIKICLAQPQQEIQLIKVKNNDCYDPRNYQFQKLIVYKVRKYHISGNDLGNIISPIRRRVNFFILLCAYVNYVISLHLRKDVHLHVNLKHYEVDVCADVLVDIDIYTWCPCTCNKPSV